ncbi:hypothetical protein QCA50_018975 [Cerrena zonata]|uniref:Copper-fist domain-containing protein n=1 Tax=Cerrena zonata TaxID=2478898 RepID=A0AAW0FGK2_9APHY
MVLVNGKKFSCESCIKGHRSSSCKHNDRPLFEVKKKGRPVSQCQQCRELRTAKKVHSKCICESKPVKPQVRQLTATAKRYIALHPTLPNGLKDVFSDRGEQATIPNPRAGVDRLLNPCNCKDIWTCQCRSKGTTAADTMQHIPDGLEVLANAATLVAQDESNPSPETDNQPSPITVEPTRSCCQSKTTSKRKDRSSRSPTPPPSTKHRGPSLAPIHISPTLNFTSIPSPLPTPNFPTIPPLSSVAALAGSGCTCGFRCTCPGCVEHRGPQHASKEYGDCTDGECTTCVDHDGGVELPSVHSHHSTQARGGGSCCGSSNPKPLISLRAPTPELVSSGLSFVDSFFARAPFISLPPAPPQRARRGTLTLDPTDTTTYPSMLFTGGLKHLAERGPAFGLVSVPKLQCCAGKCGCPDGSCGCDHTCGGCADEAGGRGSENIGIRGLGTGVGGGGCCSSRVK